MRRHVVHQIQAWNSRFEGGFHNILLSSRCEKEGLLRHVIVGLWGVEDLIAFRLQKL